MQEKIWGREETVLQGLDSYQQDLIIQRFQNGLIYRSDEQIVKTAYCTKHIRNTRLNKKNNKQMVHKFVLHTQ